MYCIVIATDSREREAVMGINLGCEQQITQDELGYNPKREVGR